MMVPKSPRARRRAAIAGAAVAAVAALAGAVQLLPGGKKLPDVVAAPAGEVAPPPPPPPRVALARADRRAIDRVLDRFVPAAVRRADPAGAYDMVTPALRAGSTRTDWATGTIPVQPFPAAGNRFRHWTLSYSYPNHVGLELLLRPKRETEIGAIAFAVDLKRLRGRWLVDSFIPAAVFSGAGAPPRISAVPDFGPTGGTRSPGSGRLGLAWFLVPAAIFVLALAALIAHAASGWLRGRRAVRAYEAERGVGRTLPPLPAPARARVSFAREGRDP